jgi:hypothetical protein
MVQNIPTGLIFIFYGTDCIIRSFPQSALIVRAKNLRCAKSPSISRATLYEKLNKYELSKNSRRGGHAGSLSY